MFNRYDPEGKGHVSFNSFVYELTGNEFTPQDNTGSHFEQSNREDMHKLKDLLDNKQKQMLQSQAAQTAALACDQIMQRIK